MRKPGMSKWLLFWVTLLALLLWFVIIFVGAAVVQSV